MEAFIAARCTLDNEYAWLDLETRIGCRGTHDIGFRPALEAWAKRHDLPVPKLELGSTTWTKKALPPAVKVKLNMTAKQLRGLEYVHASEAETYVTPPLTPAAPQRKHARPECLWTIPPHSLPLLE